MNKQLEHDLVGIIKNITRYTACTVAGITIGIILGYIFSRWICVAAAQSYIR